MGTKYQYELETFYRGDAISYYLLGAFMTDGCVSIDSKTKTKGITSLHSNDKDWLELINAYICPEKKIVPFSENCHALIINSIELAHWLIDQGCTPAKSLTLQFPNIPTEYLIDFIRGCWDGDGTLIFSKRFREDKQNWTTCRSARFYTSSKQFADAMMEAIRSLGIRGYIDARIRDNPHPLPDGRIIKSKNTEYTVVVNNGEGAYDLCKALYYPNCLAMPRKEVKAYEIIKDWEKSFQCVRCGTEMHLHKMARRTKYCEVCKPIVLREQSARTKAKARAKRKNG